jgi:dCTP diphosphatase
MTELNWDLTQAVEDIARFNASRGWSEFHNPKNLAMALSAEAGELLSIFQWMTPPEADSIGSDDEALRDELADVAIYLISLAERVGVDLPAAVAEKLQRNEGRFPSATAKQKKVE